MEAGPRDTAHAAAHGTAESTGHPRPEPDGDLDEDAPEFGDPRPCRTRTGSVWTPDRSVPTAPRTNRSRSA